MSSFKKLSKSDVTVVPYHANKQWNLSYCPYPVFPNCNDCSKDYFWTLADENTCSSYTTTASIAPASPLTAYTRSFSLYSQTGSKVYQSGWNTDGTGTIQTTLTTANLWRNTTTTNGPLNRTAVWANSGSGGVDTPIDTWIGFTYCATITETDTYYIGIGADNEFRLEIDGNVILNTINGGLLEEDKFRTWHVYPITLTAGSHIIGLFGYNLSGSSPNPAGFGCEIYNNTFAELSSATTINDLDIIFSSADFVGQTIPVAKTNNGTYLDLGYLCPNGYEYAGCNGDCWKFIYCPSSTFQHLGIYKGTNLTGSFSLDNDLITEGQYERLIYTEINHLFYQNYSASLDTSSLMNSLYYESASQQRPTSSYFVYNDNPNLIKSFPTGAMESIRVLALSQDIYGNKVLPYHFQLSSSAYFVTDDGYGNLFDLRPTIDRKYFVNGFFDAELYFNDSGSEGGRVHIGNVFYAHGLATITNQDYQFMFPQTPIAKNNSGSFVTTTTPKIISASLNDYARSGTLNTSSLSLSGSTSGLYYSWATSSNGTVILTTTTPGTYTVYYTIGADIAGGCSTNLRSNKAKITAYVQPECYLNGGAASYCLGVLNIKFSSIGADAGPFDIYSSIDNYCTPIATSVTRASLLSGPGYNINLPGGATKIRVKSTGWCLNYVDLSVVNCTSTTTSTSTTTTTLAATSTTTTSTSTTTTTSTLPPGETTTTTSTTTSTTTAPSTTTTTTSTTTTTTTAFYKINLYGRGEQPISNGAAQIEYSLNNNTTWETIEMTSFAVSSCGPRGIIGAIPGGTTVYFRVTNGVDNPVFYSQSGSSECPAFVGGICEHSVVVNSSISQSFTVQVEMMNTVSC